MLLKYEISKLALNDLDEIWNYTATEWSKKQANKYYKEILQTINHICKNSELGKPIDEVKIGHRRININSHLIIYKIFNKTIYIDRILHQKMDIENILNKN